MTWLHRNVPAVFNQNINILLCYINYLINAAFSEIKYHQILRLNVNAAM